MSVEAKFATMVNKLAVVFTLLAVLPTAAGQDTCAVFGKQKYRCK